MINEFKKYHDYIFKSFDLASPSTMSLTICKEGAFITSSDVKKFGKFCSIKNIGKELAETILLNMEVYSCEFGDWIHDQDLPEASKIKMLKKDDFELDVELLKVWTAARVVANKLLRGVCEHRGYLIEYIDSGEILICGFDTEKEFKEKVEELWGWPEDLNWDDLDPDTTKEEDPPSFGHINDCWNYLRESKNFKDLEERAKNLPKWSGSWYVEEKAKNHALIINTIDDIDESVEDIFFDE